MSQQNQLRQDRRHKLLSTELAVIRALREYDPHMQLMTAATLLEVALHDEPTHTQSPSITELAELVAVPQPTMSRLLKALSGGDTKSRLTPGQLVAVYDDPVRPKFKHVGLTDAGSVYVRQVLDIMDLGLATR